MAGAEPGAGREVTVRRGRERGDPSSRNKSSAETGSYLAMSSEASPSLFACRRDSLLKPMSARVACRRW